MTTNPNQGRVIREIEAYKAPILITLLCLIAILLFFWFSKQSLRLDEAQSLWQAIYNPLTSLEISARNNEGPLYHVILHFWQYIFGGELITARILSLVFFLASIVSIYFLGKSAYNKSLGIFVASLFTLSPFMNWYASEVRMYTLLVFLVTLNAYFFVGLLKNREKGEVWVGYGITAVLGVFTHYIFFPVLLAQSLFLLLNKGAFSEKSRRRFWKTLSLVMVLFLPWLLYSISTEGFLDYVNGEVPTSARIFDTFSNLLFGYQSEHINSIIVSFWPLTVLFGFLALRKNKIPPAPTIFFLFATIIPIAVIFISSLTITPLFNTRLLIISLPALYLLVGWIVYAYPRQLSLISQTILIAVMLIFTWVQAQNADIAVREDYEKVSQFLSTNAGPSDVIAVSTPYTVFPLEYYYQGSAVIETIPNWEYLELKRVPGFKQKVLEEQVSGFKDNYQRLWLILSYDSGYEDNVRQYLDKNFEKISERNFSPDLNLYLYKLNY